MNLARELKYLAKACSNIHRPGGRPDVLLCATPRGGSTWAMEIIASQSSMKYYDEPFNIRRDNVQRTGLFGGWTELMPEGVDREKVLGYLRDLSHNRVRHMNPPPLRKNYHPFTDRVVFKLHELEFMINDIAAALPGQVVYLLRHPIPTALSRAVFPRLEAFMASEYYRQRIPPEAWRELEAVVASGNHLQRGVVSWGFENIDVLRWADTSDWLFITYEELVLQTAPVCERLASFLGLTERERMLAAAREPAVNIAMSGVDTHKLMVVSDEDLRRRGLVTKWRANVDEAEERQAMQSLELFGIDAYGPSSFLPNPRFVHGAPLSVGAEHERKPPVTAQPSVQKEERKQENR